MPDIKRGYEGTTTADYEIFDYSNDAGDWFIYDNVYGLVASNSDDNGWGMIPGAEGYGMSFSITPPEDATIGSYYVSYVSYYENMYGDKFCYESAFNVVCGDPAVPPTPEANHTASTTTSVQVTRSEADTECGTSFTYEYEDVDSPGYVDSYVTSSQFGNSDISYLTAGKAYNVRIRANSADGLLSTYGDSVTCYTLCEAPYLTATQIGNSVLLEWNAVEGATAYLIKKGDYYYSATDLYTTVDDSELSYIDSPVAPVSTISYTVYALNEADVPGAYTEAIVYTPPGLPSGFQAESVGADIVLTWTDDINSNFVGIDYSTDGTNWIELAPSWMGVTITFTHTAPTTGTYYYRIRSYNYGYGYGDWSAPITIDFVQLDAGDIRQGETGNLALIHSGIFDTNGQYQDWSIADSSFNLVDTVENGVGGTEGYVLGSISEDGTNLYLSLTVPIDAPVGDGFYLDVTGSSVDGNGDEYIYSGNFDVIPYAVSEPSELDATLTAKIVFRNNSVYRLSCTVTPLFGSSPYTYVWSVTSGTVMTQGGSHAYIEIPNDTASTISVTVTDDDAETVTPSFDVDDLNVSTVFPFKYVSGTNHVYKADTLLTGGTGPFTYEWRTPYETTELEEPFLTFPDSGLYRVDVTVVDANGIHGFGSAFSNASVVEEPPEAVPANSFWMVCD